MCAWMQEMFQKIVLLYSNAIYSRSCGAYRPFDISVLLLLVRSPAVVQSGQQLPVLGRRHPMPFIQPAASRNLHWCVHQYRKQCAASAIENTSCCAV